jgi:hypothetical protein
MTLAYAALAVLAALDAPFPNNFDELAHLSAIVHVAWHGLPEPGAMWMLAPDLAGGFGTRANYLNHPPAYYAVLSLLLPPNGWPTAATVDVLRLVNVALSVAAVAAIMAVAWLRALPRTLTLVLGAAVLCNPVLPYLGGAINNDNLAILGGALTVLGAQWLTSRNTPGTGWALLIVGGALAALAKLTAGLMTGVFAVAFVAQRWRDQRWRERDARDWRWRDEKAAAALWLAVQAIACLPYGWYLLRYGSPTPLVESFIAEYRRIAELGTRLLGWRPQEVLSLPAYAGDFLIWLAANWNPVTGMHGWPQAVVLAGPAVVLMLAVPALGANLPPRRGADAVIGAGAVALPVMLLLHVLFSYRMYRETGSPPLDAVPRYYFPLALALVPLAACRTLARLPPAPRLVLVAAIPLVLAAALPVIARCAGGGCG